MRTRNVIIMAGAAAFLGGCAPRIYHAPHLGAEYRFDEGLPPKKPRQQLFSPSMQRSLEQSGQAPEPSKTPKTLTAVARRDSTGNLIRTTQNTNAPGAPGAMPARPDTLTSPPASPASPASSDSSRTGPR